MKSRIGHILPFLLTTAFLAGCGNREQEHQSKSAPVNVSILQVKKSSHLQELTYSATIEPDNTAKIGFAVSGIVNNVAVKEGQLVKQGQLLATIDATEYRNALAIADAGLEQAEDSYNRFNELYKKGSLPAKDFIDIKTRLAQARANKSINSKHIADSKLSAPMSGMITEKWIEQGSMAAPGVPAFTIIKTDQVYAKITVPENEVGKLGTNMHASVLVPALNDSLNGKITIINPQADRLSKTYTVKIQLPNPQQKLLPGMIANVRIDLPNASTVLIIPATAVVRDADGLTYVYAVNTQKKAIRKRITVGNLTGDREVIVKDGLQEGDNIVTEGQTNLSDGMQVSF